MKTIREEWEMMRKEMQDTVARQVMSPVTPYSNTSSNRIRQQLILQPDVVEKPMIKVIEDPQQLKWPIKSKVHKHLLIIRGQYM